MSSYKWIKGKKYYVYESYDSWGKALKVAKVKKKKNKCRYYIDIKKGDDIIFPSNKYKLYLDKCIKLF